MEDRKLEEIQFHDRLRSIQLRSDPQQYAHYTSNLKFYSVDRSNRRFLSAWIEQHCPGKKVLDYCCGEGEYTLMAARAGGDVVGIDISDVSIRNSQERAAAEGLADRATFRVMDAEAMNFPDRSFDSVVCAGVLHHLDLDRAYPELARVVKDDGEIIAIEALGHNLLIQTYRRLTPHLRTRWETEHIIRRRDIDLARRYFRDVDIRFFHIATLFAVPFRKFPFFDLMLTALERVDQILLRIPGLRWQAWMVAFVLRSPVRPETAPSPTGSRDPGADGRERASPI